MLRKGLMAIAVLILVSCILTFGMNGNTERPSASVSGTVSTWSSQELQALLEEYCIALLAKEVSSEYEDEMLKVQSVLVRTTVYQRISSGELTKMDLEGDSSVEPETWKNRLRKAFRATDGLVLGNSGGPVLVPFHQLSNGQTRDGGPALGDEFAYLKSVECLDDLNEETQLASVFLEDVEASVLEVDEAGYVLEVEISDSDREEGITGEEFRELFGLASSCFSLYVFPSGTLAITRGVGHGLGLSQHTANFMAKQGRSFKEILTYFFPELELLEVAEILWDME